MSNSRYTYIISTPAGCFVTEAATTPMQLYLNVRATATGLANDGVITHVDAVDIAIKANCDIYDLMIGVHKTTAIVRRSVLSYQEQRQLTVERRETVKQTKRDQTKAKQAEHKQRRIDYHTHAVHTLLGRDVNALTPDEQTCHIHKLAKHRNTLYKLGVVLSDYKPRIGRPAAPIVTAQQRAINKWIEATTTDRESLTPRERRSLSSRIIHARTKVLELLPDEQAQQLFREHPHEVIHGRRRVLTDEQRAEKTRAWARARYARKRLPPQPNDKPQRTPEQLAESKKNYSYKNFLKKRAIKQLGYDKKNMTTEQKAEVKQIVEQQLRAQLEPSINTSS